MSRKYKVISGIDVLNKLIQCDIDIMAPIRCINLVNIADLLGTSRYQVKKYMDMLVENGVAELTTKHIPDEYENYPPYHGYQITDIVKNDQEIPGHLDKPYIMQIRERYKKAYAEHAEIIKQIWN